MKKINRTLLISWLTIIVILLITYSLEVIKHERTFEYTLIFALVMIVPFSVVALLYNKNKEWEHLGYAVVIGYSFMYAFVLFTGATQMVFCYILPLLCFLILYHKPRLILFSFLIAVILNVASLLYQFEQNSITIANSKDVEIRFAAIILCYAGAYVSAGLYNMIHNDNQRYIVELAQKNQEIQDMAIQTIATIANTIDAKDEYTRGHSKRVAEISVAIAKDMGMPAEEINNLRSIALLHDIGKIGVPDTVLNKPGKLTDDEYELMKQHTVIGADILKDIKMFQGIDVGARSHHEKYDGTGYPEKISGENIPYIARIIAVADAFDAMTSNRVYRKRLDLDYVVEELKRCSGSQFDPDIVNVLIRMLEEKRLNPSADNQEEEISELSKIWTRVMQKEEEKYKAAFDELTGLLLRAYGEKKIVSLIKERPGALIFCDMDNLKTINDRFGHKSGDKALKILGSVIGEFGENGVACRVGGDEFLLYLDNVNENEVVDILESITDAFRNEVASDKTINIATISAGVCLTIPADLYANVLNKADKALYHVKQRGKAGYYIYKDELDNIGSNNHVDINQVTRSIIEAGKYDGALDVEYRQFTKMYEYLNNLCTRYDHSCNVVLVTLDAKSNSTMFIDEIEQGMKCMEMAIKNTIRNVDICTKYSSVQFLIVLLEAGDENIHVIINRIFTLFYKMSQNPDLIPRYEVSTLSIS
ncbi:MAG: diguanylate cyclase [Lachnospiraceae bacterium]|nr:diguanylate cyclase [Lachnospiraceae bacterium]